MCAWLDEEMDPVEELGMRCGGSEKNKQTWRNSKVRLAKTGSAVGYGTIHGLKFEAIGGHRGFCELTDDRLAMVVSN